MIFIQSKFQLGKIWVTNSVKHFATIREMLTHRGKMKRKKNHSI